MLRKAKALIAVAGVFAMASCQTAQKHEPLARLPSTLTAPEALPLNPPPVALAHLETPEPAAARTIAQAGALIDKAEAAYTEGLSDYQSGDLEQAKQEFDRSISVLLQSG